MEKKTIRSGMPFIFAGVGVMAFALLFGMGSFLGYAAGIAVGIGGFMLGKRMFPDQVIEVEAGPKSGSSEVDSLILEARGQLDEIRRANDAIADPSLSAQIADIEGTCRSILSRLEEQPDMLSSLRTFLRYYLPTTQKLLQARAKIENEVNKGESGAIAARITDAISAIQTAFHKQLAALDEFRFINLESEMDALKSMLAGDGLTDEAEAPAATGEEDPFAGLFSQGGK